MKFLTLAIAFCAISSLSLPGSCAVPVYLPESDWEKALFPSPGAFHVCRGKGTEKAGSGIYDNFYEKGTYYCACCGGDYPLYSSKDKFESGTGWPSFTRPIDPKAVSLVPETRLFSRLLGATTEVQCARCGSHLGHVFDDGPKERNDKRLQHDFDGGQALTGKRYCMNSVALTFTPEDQTPVRTFPEPMGAPKK